VIPPSLYRGKNERGGYFGVIRVLVLFRSWQEMYEQEYFERKEKAP